MKNPLNRELHKILNEMSKRQNSDCKVWYTFSPTISNGWNCHICNCEYTFTKSVNEVFVHGYEHLKNNNLLPFI